MTLKLAKQAGTLVLASSLLLTAAPAVWASGVTVDSTSIAIPAFPGVIDGKMLDAKITKEEAMERAKAYITLPEGFTFNRSA